MTCPSLRAFFVPLVAALILGGWTLAGPATAADEPKTAADAKQPAKKERAEARGYLPPYYKNVVDGIQREKIYKIQEQHAAKIAEVKKQLQALEDQRDAEIAAVLTPEQKKKIEELAAAAKTRREPAKKSETPAATASSDSTEPKK